MWSLEGTKILDLTQNVAGPYAGMILAEFGADVTKVEPPNGDPTRHWGPPYWGGNTPSYLALNRNKKIKQIDMKEQVGKEEVNCLISSADVVLVSNRPSALRELGLDYETIVNRNHSVIYGEVTAFGKEGPKSNEPGYDPLMQAMAGIMSVTGHPNQDPVRVGTSIIDMSTGMWLALGVLNAVMVREKDGKSKRVTSSLYETAVSWMSYHLAAYWASGEAPSKWGSGNAMISPYEAYPTQDDWIVIAAGNDKLFKMLCEVLEKPSWLEDEQFKTNELRVKHRLKLQKYISTLTKEKPSNHWITILKEKGVPVAPVLDVAGLNEEPQLHASGIVQEIKHPNIKGFKSIGLPILIDNKRPELRIPPI